MYDGQAPIVVVPRQSTTDLNRLRAKHHIQPRNGRWRPTVHASGAGQIRVRSNAISILIRVKDPARPFRQASSETRQSGPTTVKHQVRPGNRQPTTGLSTTGQPDMPDNRATGRQAPANYITQLDRATRAANGVGQPASFTNGGRALGGSGRPAFTQAVGSRLLESMRCRRKRQLFGTSKKLEAGIDWSRCQASGNHS